MLLAALTALALSAPLPADSFPHAQHRRLFTSCTSCHAGIASGDSSAMLPTTASCASCHDGQDQRLVSWSPHPPRPTNLRFDHRTHFAKEPGEGGAPDCRACHARDASGVLMVVGQANPATCTTCHAHEAGSHLSADSRCTGCHVPLTAASGLSAAAIAAFPKPPSHDTSYVFRHADDAQRGAGCQVCHARESCAACHVNADRLAPIQALGTDVRVATLARARHVVYRAPANHAAADFTRGHGLLARRGTEACANCHTRESCLACHGQQARVPFVAAMPARTPGGAPGVELAAMRPPGHLPDFAANHRAAAAAGDASCSRCHTQRYCATCHDGAARPSFHVANFLQNHARASYNQVNECATCHQVQAFCQACHRQSGLAPLGATTPGKYHTNQPNWTFGHAGAARRSLESCTSCHQQNFCLTCHSASRGWRVSPHGPGFDPDMGDRNAAMCRVCHVQGAPRN